MGGCQIGCQADLRATPKPSVGTEFAVASSVATAATGLPSLILWPAGSCAVRAAWIVARRPKKETVHRT